MPDPVYRLLLAEGDGDPCEASFTQTSWWDWIYTAEPAIPDGKSSVSPQKGDMPDDLWDMYVASGMGVSLTAGSYQNDKAILIYYVLSEAMTAETPDAFEEAVKASPAGEMPDVHEYHGYMY